MKMVSKNIFIAICMTLTFGVNAQVSQMDVYDVINIITSGELSILNDKPRYASVESEISRLIKMRKDVGFCSKKQILKINNQYIEDTIPLFWGEYSFKNIRIIPREKVSEVLDSKIFILTIVTPIFSENMKRCLVNVSFKQNKNKGRNVLFYFKKKKGIWTLKSQYTLFVS